MNAIDSFGFASQERAIFDLPDLTEIQERRYELFKRCKEIDSELLALLDEKEEIRDQLKEMGIFMTC